MSYTVITKMPGNIDVFSKALGDRPDDFLKIAEKGRAHGALHHRFAVGDGFILAIDEWADPSALGDFFGDPEFVAFVTSVGGDLSTQPESWVGESISSPDQF